MILTLEFLKILEKIAPSLEHCRTTTTQIYLKCKYNAILFNLIFNEKSSGYYTCFTTVIPPTENTLKVSKIHYSFNNLPLPARSQS